MQRKASAELEHFPALIPLWRICAVLNISRGSPWATFAQRLNLTLSLRQVEVESKHDVTKSFPVFTPYFQADLE